MRHASIVLLALLTAAPAMAQEWQVARETYAFAGSQLTIRVEAQGPGALQVIRGGSGAVTVAARADRGFTAGGLTAGEELTLTAAGAGPVQYLVAVPEEVWIDVRLPGGHIPTAIGAHTRSQSFHWGSAARAVRTAETSPRATAPGTYHTALDRSAAPHSVVLPELENVRSVTVRVEGQRFRVSTPRPMGVQEGTGQTVVVEPGPPAMDVVLTVPADTRRFRLVTGGDTALSIDDGEVTPLCAPRTEQWLSNDRRWLTFNPVDGTLECSAPPTPRHEGRQTFTTGIEASTPGGSHSQDQDTR